MKRLLAGIIACLVAGTTLAEAPGAGHSPERAGVHLGFFGHSPYTARWKSNWPSTLAVLKTPKVQTGISVSGPSYLHNRSNIFEESPPGFVFGSSPSLSMVNEMAVWVGGIRSGDTLVSTGKRWGRSEEEFYTPNSPLARSGVGPEAIGIGKACRVEVVDTFTTVPFLSNLPSSWDPDHGRHIPLGVSILLRAYVWDCNVFQNILLMDYTVTNVSGSPLEDVWFGIVMNPSIWPFSLPGYWTDWKDNVFESSRDQGLLCVWDHDGGVSGTHFSPDSSVIDGFGFRPVLSCPIPAETTFNWAADINDYRPDTGFAPRKRGTGDDPFRPYYSNEWEYDGFSEPGSDRDRYYQMSHPEWDYDLLDMGRIGDNDPVWLPPDTMWIDTLKWGGAVLSYLSMGPFDLSPDSTFRIVYAMFGADAVLTDPSIGSLLLAGDVDEYRRRLNLQVFRDRGEDAVAMAQYLLSPEFSPTGLKVSYFDADSVTLTWDARVFPDITGYRVRLSSVPQSAFVAPGQVRPGAAPGDDGVIHAVAPHERSVTIRDLIPGKYYLAQVAYDYDGNCGRYSYPVVVGYGNAALTPDPPKPIREFAFVSPSDTGVLLQWEEDSNGGTAYYKVYRTTDSAVAANRYRSFFAVDSTLTPFQPVERGVVGDLPWYYYEMQAYDSVPIGQQFYLDRNIQPEAWYWVSAVGRYGYESEFSPLIHLEQSRQPDRDILVILGATTAFHDFVIRDSLYAYYHRLLDGYDYDLYDWADTNANVHADQFIYRVDWDDLSRYRLILVEELPSTAILTGIAEDGYKTLQRLVASGRDVLYFGVPASGESFNLAVTGTVIESPVGSFEVRYLGLDSVALRPWKGVYNVLGVTDSLAGFAGAEPVADGPPPLAADLASCRVTDALTRLFSHGGCLPMTPAFYPDDRAEVIYRYRSAYPQTSELDGLPCGLRMRHPGANAYAFSFHLWGINESDARALVDFALDHQEPDTVFSPRPLPTSFRLYQNFPNPFNPSTTIAYDLFQSGHVRLEVFNILGQKVTTLVDSYHAAGVYEAVWHGRDGRGHSAASGIYLYRIETAGGSLTRKMLLMK